MGFGANENFEKFRIDHGNAFASVAVRNTLVAS
jgi:hypothetical protein